MDRERIWKEHMEKLMNEENIWDKVTYANKSGKACEENLSCRNYKCYQGDENREDS